MPSVLAMTASTVRLVRVCFSCLMCGLDTPNLEVRIDDLSRVAVRRALAGVVSDLAPIWDESLIPHCPRCRGRLLLEFGSVPSWREQQAAAEPVA
jgi:hypothetical protein